ncbi:ABC transporter permease [uncultured Alsobacter sp.]|uniref:ABC transporter permease n=1 Tax=uncultured Alsobacter sp. TaxID=1748258 RepID=UPI0025F839BB|nr:ABC transporter permease [uncultured Alsobacter sp.]
MGPAILRLVGWAALIAVLVAPQVLLPFIAPLAPAGAPVLYDRASLAALFAAHAAMVAGATVAAVLVAVPLAIVVTRPSGAAYQPLARLLVNLGQTVPPVAVLAITVPLVGFGVWPTCIALFAYGLLPVFEGALAGLRLVPEDVRDSAQGMGLTPGQVLVSAELPLALPQILSGIRVSAIVAMGTATIGSTVAAPGLGEVIIAGLLSDNAAFVAQGGGIVALAAVLMADALAVLERRAARP